MVHPALLILLGDDRQRKLTRVRELARALNVLSFDRHSLDSASTSAAALGALCRQQPALSSLRVIVLDEAHRLSAACVQVLREHAEARSVCACVVLCIDVELTARHPVSQLFAHGQSRQHDAQHQEGPMPHGTRIAIERYVTSHPPAVTPFAFTEALGQHDLPAALSAVHDQLIEGKEPLELLGLVAWQLQRWVLVRRLRDAGEPRERLIALTGFPAWQVDRLSAQVSRRSLTRLTTLLARCWQLDVDAKAGRIRPECALEPLVIEVCALGA